MIASLVLASFVVAVPPPPPPGQCQNLKVGGAWVRTLPPGAKNTAAYFVVDNVGAAAAQLVSATSPLAPRVELHTHLHEGGVMKMRQVDHVDVDAGAAVRFEPMGLHVMIFDATPPAAPAATTSLTLTCKDGSSVVVDAVFASASPFAGTCRPKDGPCTKKP
jgi:copper(I)-binding protein